MRWSSVVRQCRFDCVRVDLFGLSNMLFMLLFPVLSCVAALVLTVTGAPGQVAVSVYGGVCGMAAVMSWMSALSVNVAEESGGHRAMNGMIPIARTSQVAGRFLFLLVTCAMWTVDVMACSVFFAFGDHDGFRLGRCHDTERRHLRVLPDRRIDSDGVFVPVHVPGDDADIRCGHSRAVCTRRVAVQIAV